MCGIVGYIGYHQAYPLLFKGLERLEYRGYDSAGIAVYDQERIQVNKAKGQLHELAQLPALTGKIGIGHTRWATHGTPSDTNAHPHGSCDGKVYIVHNGIIDNYLELRDWLCQRGHTFVSETDSEVISHLIEEYLKLDRERNLLQAVIHSLKKLQGAYAIAVLSADHPDQLVVARQDSPLVVAHDGTQGWVASDIPALLDYSREIYVLEDGEVGVVSCQGLQFYSQQGHVLTKRPLQISWTVAAAEKGGYPHYMLKEIMEQPDAVRNTLKNHLVVNGTPAINLGLQLDVERIQRIYLVGMGTARHAGLVGSQLIEQLAQIPTHVEIAAEFRYRSPLIDQQCLTIAISQSGETADTLVALQEAKSRGSQTLAITNVQGSSIERVADQVLYTAAGPEIAVASTKAYTTQLVCLALLACYLAQNKGYTVQHQLLTELWRIPFVLTELLVDVQESVQNLAEQLHTKQNMFFIGRGLDYPVVQEGALKLKEISYIHAEAYAAGELKHGTLALVEENVVVLALACTSHVFDKMIGNIKEVKARGATVVAFANQRHQELAAVADAVIPLPKVHDLLTPLISVVPLQLLAYYTAVARGCNVDKPRNLAKSVTVE